MSVNNYYKKVIVLLSNIVLFHGFCLFFSKDKILLNFEKGDSALKNSLEILRPKALSILGLFLDIAETFANHWITEVLE